MRRVLRWLTHLPPPLVRAVAGGRVVVDGQELDPQTQLVNLALRGLLRRGIEDASPEQGRARMRRAVRLLDRPEVAQVLDRTLPGPAGPIPVRVYRPAGAPDVAPAIVALHGGGWVLGDLTTHDRTCRLLARGTGCVVVAVHYRRAPEDRFPAALDDAVAAWLGVVDQAEAWGIDPTRVVIEGDSAGGNLAAATCLRLRVRGGPMPVLQVLVYPATDLSCERLSARHFHTGYLLSTPTMRWFVGQYIPDADQRRDPFASPLRAPDLAGLPPAHVVVAGFDPLRDEGLAYVDALREAGVPADLAFYPGTMHGFFGLDGLLDVATEAMATACAAIRRAVQPADG
ncbi:MAG: alpha/beta hydrolase [Alphaproteobacteria bacterium]|nr:alpha/beta hydrolase [Alphaproteobacteria bacterium]